MAPRSLHRAALRAWKYLPLGMRRWLVRILFVHGPIGAVAVITDGEGRVLFVHPTYRRDHNWSLPGGFTGYGERPVDTVRREVREELGNEIAVSRLLAEGTGDYGDVAFAYEAAFRDPARALVLSAELDAWRYFPRDGLPPLAPAIEQLVRYALAELDRRGSVTPAP